MHSRAIMGALAAVAITLLPGIRQAEPAATTQDPNRTFTPVAKYAVGDLLKYRLSMAMNMEMVVPGGESPMPPMSVSNTSTVAMKTAGIKPDGAAVIVITTTSGKTTMNGQERAMPQTPPVTMEVDKRGIAKMRGMEKIPGAEALGEFMNMTRMPTMGAVLPDHPVKVGESWEAELPAPMGGKTMKVVSTLLGVEMIGNQETLKIKQDLTMPLQMGIGKEGKPTRDMDGAMMTMTGSITSSNVMNVLESGARLLRLVGDSNADIEMRLKGETAKQSPFGDTMNMKMGMKMKMDLLSAGKVQSAPAKPAAKPRKKG
jgi:hypothetical protein